MAVFVSHWSFRDPVDFIGNFKTIISARCFRGCHVNVQIGMERGQIVKASKAKRANTQYVVVVQPFAISTVRKTISAIL